MVMSEAHTNRRLLWLIVVLFWVIALVVWWAVLWHLDWFMSFTESGFDLPSSTVFAGEAVHFGAPFALAAVFSAVAIYAIYRHRDRALSVSAWLLCIAIFLSLIVMSEMTFPMVKLCGETLPGWTSTFELSGPRRFSELVTLRAETECGVY